MVIFHGYVSLPEGMRHCKSSSHIYIENRQPYVSSKKIIQSKAPLSLALGLAAFHALAFAFALGLVDFGLFHPDPLSTCMVSHGSQSWLCFKQRNHQPVASTCINLKLSIAGPKQLGQP